MRFKSPSFSKTIIILLIIFSIAAPAIFSLWLFTENERLRLEVEELRMGASRRPPLSITVEYPKDEDNLGEISPGTNEGKEETVPSPPIAEPLSYQTLYPDMYFIDPISPTAAIENTVYLTFDDGPSRNTPKILDSLKDEGVHATFFVIGKEDAASKETMRRIVDEGHTIGIHTYSHVYKDIYASVEAYLADFYKLFTLIHETTGVYPRVFRFAGGSVNAYNVAVHREIIAEMLRRGFVYYDWNVSGEDAIRPAKTSLEISQSILNGLSNKNRAIVLMHDSNSNAETVKAIKTLIPAIKKKGYSLSPITTDTLPIIFSYTPE